MPKFFVNNNQKIENNIYIKGEDFNHIKNVLRMKMNDEIKICIIDLKETYLCTVSEFLVDSVRCSILDKIESYVEPKTFISIFQGLPKSDKMELIIEKCTEIGGSEFTPVRMDRCVVKLDDKDAEKKVARWQKIAESAAKQSGRDMIPKVNNIISYKEIFSKLDRYDLVIIAYELEKELLLKDILNTLNREKNNKIAFIIGPEGGISEEEIEIAKNSNISVVTLGNRILRTETAPIVISANTIYELG